MGHCGDYFKFIYTYATIAKLLYALSVNFEQTSECNEAFEKLKNTLVNDLILRALYWNKPLHVHIDASNFAIGCVLAQLREHNMDFLVSYASK